LDRTLRRTAGAVRGLEESISAAGHARRTLAWGRADHAIGPDVREVGDRGDRGELAAGQGTCGTPARDASGSAGEKNATEANHESCTSQRVPRDRVSAGTQPALCARGSPAGGLPPSSAVGRRTPPHFPAGNGTHDQQRLGGAVSEPVLSAAAAEPAICARPGQGGDL